MTRAFAGNDWSVRQFNSSTRPHRIAQALFERRTPPPRLSVLQPGRQATRRRRRVSLVLVPVVVAMALAGAAIVVLGPFA
jgi:hypothetical protein